MNIRFLLSLGVSVLILWSCNVLFRGVALFWLTTFSTLVLFVLLEKRQVTVGLFASLFAGLMAACLEKTIQPAYSHIEIVQSELLTCALPMLLVGLLIRKDNNPNWLSS